MSALQLPGYTQIVVEDVTLPWLAVGLVLVVVGTIVGDVAFASLATTPAALPFPYLSLLHMRTDRPTASS